MGRDFVMVLPFSEMDAVKERRFREFRTFRKKDDLLGEVEKHLHVYQHRLRDIDQENLRIMVIIYRAQLFLVFH